MGVTLAAAGLYLVYAGIRDVPLVDGLRELAAGRVPTGRAQKKTGVRMGIASGRAVGSASRLLRPVPGAIGDGFGAPRDGGTRRHKGVDMAGSTGDPIRAAMAGKVIKRGYDPGAGNHINLRHPNGWVTKYFHMSRYNVGYGAEVAAGQVIGFVGSTGHSSGPHLHFEVWIDGEAVDPAPYIGG